MTLVAQPSTVPAGGPHDRPRGRDRANALRLGWLAVWTTALVVSVYSRFGGTGLVSPDDGFILAQSRRILSGQIPHRDFISPRPVGSALLHCIDFAVPLPLISASRLVSAIEVVAYTLAFAGLTFRKPLRRWSIAQVAAAAAAVFVNLHSFPLMAWHTIDGLLLVALGVVALHRGLETNRATRAVCGLLLLGSAVVVKQSFAPALLLGVVMVWEHRRVATREARSECVSIRRACAVLAAPAFAYGLIVTVAGGLPDMLVQMSHAQPAYGESLVTILWRSGGQTPVLVAAAIALCLIDARAGSGAAGRRVARLGARAGLSALVVGVLLVTRTDPADAWGRSLLMLLAVVVGWEWMTDRHADRFGFVLIAAAWMTSLSWGYPTPRLVAGSVSLVVIDRLWRRAPALPVRFAAKVGSVATVFAVVTSFAVMTVAIRERALLDAVAASGDRSIGDVAPDLRGLRIDLTTSTLIRDVAQCRARYPARWTAVLPGPAIVAPIMNLDDPFSIDWVYPPELVGSGDRLVEEARTLDAEGNYLVLVVRPDPAVPAPPNPVLDRMLGQLTGVRSSCGNFIAIHSASRSEVADALESTP